jgi:hypothetical protein
MLIADYQTIGPGPTAPGRGSEQPTLHDTNDFEHVARSIVVFAAGTVKFTSIDDMTDTWTIPAAAVPYTIPVAAKRIWTNGTTVTAANLRVLR